MYVFALAADHMPCLFHVASYEAMPVFVFRKDPEEFP